MLNTIHINTYQRLGLPNVESTLPIIDWLNQIKNSEHSDLITTARNYKKGSQQYSAIKGALPCVTYNFQFDSYKKNENILAPTGLIYIDIDEVSFDIECLDLNKVFAYYKSFGGNGYCILIRVEGLTLDNFKSTFDHICIELGLIEVVDLGACKPTQYSVLSFDPDVYINTDSFVFSSIEKDPKPYVIEKKEDTYTQGLGSFNNCIRFDDLDKVEINGNYEVFPDGLTIIKCSIPMKPITINRNNALLAYCNNLVWLNKALSIEACMTIMANVNKKMCLSPVDNSQLKRIVNSVFTYKENGTLKPIEFNKKRMVVFNKEYDVKPIDKLIIAGKISNDIKSNKAKQKIYETLENWDFDRIGKITQLKLMSESKISKNSIQKYWKEFKSFVRALNESCRERNKNKVGTTIPTINDNVELNPFVGLKLSDTVCVRSFLVSLYKQINETVDFNCIEGFKMILNKSYATIEEILIQLFKVFRENKYYDSPYKHLNIPSKIVQMVVDNKERLKSA